MRTLDIGPGRYALPNAETLDVQPPATFVCHAARPKAPKGVYDLVHASHVVEHLDWWDVPDALRAWSELLRPGGVLEVWAPNGYALMRCLVHLEESDEWSGPNISTWKRDLTRRDPYLWAVGRLLNYPRPGDGGANNHRAIITPKYLQRCLVDSGLTQVRPLDPKTETRGKNHGWIHMGARGVRPCP